MTRPTPIDLNRDEYNQGLQCYTLLYMCAKKIIFGILAHVRINMKNKHEE